MAFGDPFAAHRDVGVPIAGGVWRDERFEREDLAGMIFQDGTFERASFREANLTQTMFIGCVFDECVFESCVLVQTRWVSCRGSGMRIVGGQLAETVVTEGRFGEVSVGQSGRQVVFAQSEVERLAFDGEGTVQHVLTLSDCSFGALSAERAAWTDGTSVGVDFGRCSLGGASFRRCSFIRARGEGADFSDVSFDACNLYRGGFDEARFLSAEGTIFAECAMRSGDFREAALERSLFANVRAPSARFDRARLAGALFPGADLAGASFAGAHAPQSVWTDANLADANLARLLAPGAVFRNASLVGADVDGADLSDTDLHGVRGDLTGAHRAGSRGTIEWRAKLEREMGEVGEAADQAAP